MKKAIFAMLATAAAVFAQSALAETVEIASAADWAAFAGRVNNGETTLDAKLTADITLTGDPVRVGLVTTGDGAVTNTYAGVFDGQGYTIILDWEARIIDASMDVLAPFAFVSGCTIHDLHIAGSISTDIGYAAGFMGYLYGGAVFERCRCSVSITAKSENGAAFSGGFFASTAQMDVTREIVFRDCLFDGALQLPKSLYCAGFGLNLGDVSYCRIYNSLFAPSNVQVTSAAFACWTFVVSINSQLSNVYRTQTFGTEQGTDASSMSAGELAAALGENWKVLDGKPTPVFNSGLVLSDKQICTVASDKILAGAAGESAIAVEDGASAIINIKSGATLTVTGADANGTTGAAPAIRVPENSTLYIVGDGTLVATGGAAANGGNGFRGGNGFINQESKYGEGGEGGEGGAGGGGGAPAIGGAGGAGGNGGMFSEWSTYYCSTDEFTSNGRDGHDGEAGTNGSGMGAVVILGNVTVQATAGAAASSDGSGGLSGYEGTDSGSGWSDAYVAAGGGGGGGGARGQGAQFGIGGGGSGGGGGGAGGNGGTTVEDISTDFSKVAWGQGGGGGRGAESDGGTGSSGGPQYGYASYGTAKGGNGGNGGAGAAHGGNGTLQTLGSVSLTVSPARTASQPAALSAEDAPAAPVTVTFMSDGASVGTEQATLMLAPPAAPALASKTGYEFQGFYTADGTQIYSDSGAVYPVWQTVEDTTLYARWKLEAVGFTFSSGGAEIGTGSCLLSTSTATDAPIALKQGDDIFLGYFTEPTGGVKVYDENYEFALADTSILTDENIALYAQWKPVARKLEGGITRLVYRGVLTNFGEWTSGLKKTMHVKVYDSASAAEPLWSGDVADVPINPDGSFEAVFGNDELALAFASNDVTHVELTVGDALSPLAPRRAFASVASVNRALVAEGAASDIKVGTLGANAIVAEKITAGTLEASETVRVEGSVSVEVKPFDIKRGQETTIWRGAGVTAWGDPEHVDTFNGVVAGQKLWTADRDGVAVIHCSGDPRSTLRIPATIQFVRPGDEVRAPTWDSGKVNVTFWGYKR